MSAPDTRSAESMPSRAVVRPAVAADAAALAELRWELRAPLAERPAPRAEFTARCVRWMRERLAAEGAWRCWVALAPDAGDGGDGAEQRRDGAIVGAVWIQVIEKVPVPADLPEEYAYLTSFYVRPAHRGRGVGDAILRAALAWCDARPTELVILWPTARSRPLYARHGFRESGELMERRHPGAAGPRVPASPPGDA